MTEHPEIIAVSTLAEWIDDQETMLRAQKQRTKDEFHQGADFMASAQTSAVHSARKDLLKQLREDFGLGRPEPQVGDRWKHYKGGEYMIRGRGLDEATKEPVVIYESVVTTLDDLWVRPLKSFMQEVQANGGPSQFRFELVQRAGS